MPFTRSIAMVLLAVGCGGGPELRGPTSGGVTVPETPALCIALEPNLIEFGEHPVDIDGPLRTYAIVNTCQTDLIVTKIEFAQQDPPFVLEPPLDAELTLRPGQSRAFGVRFVPDLYLPRSAKVLVHSNDSELPIEVLALQGVGICKDGQTDDADEDLVPDDCDVCPGGDDRLDYDADGVPDECDFCPTVDDEDDEDGDGVADPCDVCDGGDDTVDVDGDFIPDECDRCLLGNDADDADNDFIPDACDVCPGSNDHIDTDLDGVPEGCDICQGFNDILDTDGDEVPNGCDLCEGFDDNVDTDGDGIPDGCDD